MGHEQLNVRLPADLAHRFSDAVKALGETKTDVLRELIAGWTSEHQRQGERHGDVR